jgi:hypothetical protein
VLARREVRLVLSLCLCQERALVLAQRDEGRLAGAAPAPLRGQVEHPLELAAFLAQPCGGLLRKRPAALGMLD